MGECKTESKNAPFFAKYFAKWNVVCQRKTNIVRFHFYTESKKQMNKQNKIHRCGERSGGCQRGEGLGGGWDR